MRVLVAGGTGVVGRRLVRLLTERGHDVTATTTSESRAGLLRAAGATPVVVDGLDRAGLHAALAAAAPDVVVHEMTALGGALDLRRFDRAFARTNELRTRGTDNLLDAAAAAGVGRVVAQSFAGWPAAPGPEPATEETPFDPDPPRSQRATLDAIRHLERRVGEAAGTVVRYGMLYGPGASDGMVAAVRRGRMPLVGRASGVWSFLHADDAASATLAAIERGEPGVFNVVDDEPAVVADWLPYLARVVGAPPPRRVPVPLARLLAGEAVVALMTRGRAVSNARAKQALGWQPRWASWREGFAYALADPPATQAAAAPAAGEPR